MSQRGERVENESEGGSRLTFDGHLSISFDLLVFLMRIEVLLLVDVLVVFRIWKKGARGN